MYNRIKLFYKMNQYNFNPYPKRTICKPKYPLKKLKHFPINESTLISI